MGANRAADPGSRTRRPRARRRHARNLQRHRLRAALRLQLAHAAPRFTPVGHGALLLPPFPARRHLTQRPRALARQGAPGRGPPPPTQCGHPGQSVGQDDKKGGPKRGYDGVKKVNGRKRHLLVDTLGLILAVVVHAADVGEREGARRLLELVLKARQAGRGCFERLKHVWVDAGYQSKEWVAWIEAALGWTVEIVRKPRRWVWCPVDVEPPPMP